MAWLDRHGLERTYLKDDCNGLPVFMFIFSGLLLARQLYFAYKLFVFFCINGECMARIGFSWVEYCAVLLHRLR